MKKIQSFLVRFLNDVALLVIGSVLIYLACWVSEEPAFDGSVPHWSLSRCGFAIFFSMLALLFTKNSIGKRP